MSADLQIDGFLATADVEKLTSYSRRWLSHLVEIGKFPAPDVKGRRGSAHRWRRSTIERALDQMVADGKPAA